MKKPNRSYFIEESPEFSADFIFFAQKFFKLMKLQKKPTSTKSKTQKIKKSYSKPHIKKLPKFHSNGDEDGDNYGEGHTNGTLHGREVYVAKGKNERERERERERGRRERR